ncbi:hypothetical protein I6A84_17595 [Frankia sp. CNm7]|uniref:Terpene synthase n=1 Tax=Frankia nepalensis TaxID=1836974 RepID=A0A937RPJ6_9ACTN|nr:terpene synthase family protein [Frankia nepalensis]MBL7497662.1 hypothetical protein [Frankia nepalensis]MBL7510023.1 hypothetical protein [Frankia nepalensis]MBL7519859.1 hypothetical protein [Frankia nepalensis]MBL7631044.1 hypothetical protein [Frankia nepalensis]
MAVPEPRPLDGIDPDHLERVVATAERAVIRIAPWTSRYPIMDGTQGPASRAVFASLMFAAGLPDGPLDRIVDLTRAALTVACLDDLADGVIPGYSCAAVEALARDCAALWAGEAETGRRARARRAVGDEEGQVLAAYRDCVERVAGYPAYRWAGRPLARAWRRAFASTVLETRWRFGLAPTPTTLDDYLPVRAQSVFYPALCATALAASHLPPVADGAVRAYEDACHLAGLAVRVANDLQSVERELAEGSPNAMAILLASGHTMRQAADELLAILGAALADLTEALTLLPPVLAGLGDQLARMTRFTCAWYLARDTYGLTSQGLRDLTSHPRPDRRPA